MPIELDASEKITRDQTKALVAGIAAFVSEAYLCNPKKRLLICRDPEDNMILECCLAARAELLITEIVISWKFHGLLFGPRVSQNCESSGQPATRERNSADAAKQG